jgi:hypothetical protein
MPCLIVALFAMADPAVAADPDLTKIDRTIAKEPAYKATPRYCLLVFGPEAQSRVWLVLDGEVLYVDSNGNGDLAEPAERVEPAKADWANGDPNVPRLYRHFYEIADLGDSDGGTKFGTLHVQAVGPARAAPHENRCAIDIEDQGAGAVAFAGREDAPILHFGGPLTMRVELPQHFVRGMEPRPFNIPNPVNWLQVCAGTPGVGNGNTFVRFQAMHDDTRKENLEAQADIDVPCQGNRTRRVSVKLIDSCCAPFTFEGPVSIPEDAVAGKAKATVRFTTNSKHRIAPATFEVPIVDAAPAAKTP